MGKVVYLTGAPATGKSTLCQRVAQLVPDLRVLSYSTLLRDYIERKHGLQFAEDGIRKQSALVVTRGDVAEVDEWLINEVEASRPTRDVIIDSHPVTKEEYGFRVTPFSVNNLKRLDADTFICLYASPQVLADRIRTNPAGRPLPTEFELAMHVQTQVSLATQYGLLLEKSCYLLDSAVDMDVLAAAVLTTAKLQRAP
ncbi:ATP-binding protein [Paraburkholderia phytofirmans]|nr:ATP-binding protein [Paraburkholderia phytofirmans]